MTDLSCPIAVGREMRRPGSWFKQSIVEIHEHFWLNDLYCHILVLFSNGDHALLRWRMLDGNPMSSWDSVDELIEIRSALPWVNKGIWHSFSRPSIAECTA